MSVPGKHTSASGPVRGAVHGLTNGPARVIAIAGAPQVAVAPPVSAQENLTRAFLTFTQAAGSLEHSYTQLQTEVSRLHQELQRANVQLDRSLEENARVRGYLSRVLESLPCGVLVADNQGRTQIINPEARRLLQVPAQWAPEKAELPGNFEKLIAEVPKNSFFCEQEAPLPGSGGNRFIGILRANVSEGPDGQSDTVWIVRDITEQKRLAGERESARRSRALAEVATVLAHEIRNPLGSMELFTGLLSDATAHLPETRQWVTHLQAGLRALSATVNNVLHFHGRPEAQMMPTELDRLVTETMDFLLPLARQRGQQIVVNNAIGTICTNADANRLKQVFFNVALNAFRAMPPGGKLTVHMRWAPQFPGGLAQIDFHDDGRGIPAELLDKIYEPGFTTTPGSPGLGLAVCKKVIEQHGGEIRMSSKPQHGTTVSLFLPVTGASA
jgi:signal transduction histidine kinase